MGTFPSDKRIGNRTAAILPINPGSDRESASHPHDEGGNRSGNGPSETPRRLTFTVDEAALLLNISRGLAYELVARGELGSIRLGRRIVIPRVVLEEMTGTTID
jgi:excisionase family DNA binding protein